MVSPAERLLLVMASAVPFVPHNLSEAQIERSLHIKDAELDQRRCTRPSFCLCSACSAKPLLRRTDVITQKAAREHCKNDVANGKRTANDDTAKYVSKEQFLKLYSGFLRGTHNEWGQRLQNLNSTRSQETSGAHHTHVAGPTRTNQQAPTPGMQRWTLKGTSLCPNSKCLTKYCWLAQQCENNHTVGALSKSAYAH